MVSEAVYLASTDIGLQLCKAYYPCSRWGMGECFYFFCFFTFIHFPPPMSLSFISSSISLLSDPQGLTWLNPNTIKKKSKVGPQNCWIQIKMYRLYTCMAIFLYNLYIFVCILHSCLANRDFALDPSNSVIKRCCMYFGVCPAKTQVSLHIWFWSVFAGCSSFNYIHSP